MEDDENAKKKLILLLLLRRRRSRRQITKQKNYLFQELKLSDRDIFSGIYTLLHYYILIVNPIENAFSFQRNSRLFSLCPFIFASW